LQAAAFVPGKALGCTHIAPKRHAKADGVCFAALPPTAGDSVKQLTGNEMAMAFLALGILLGMARLFGELAKHLKQPVVLGEIAAGIVLGPTVFGSLCPQVAAVLFPREGPGAIALQGFCSVAVALFLLVAGMEVHVGTIWRQGKTAVIVSLAGIIVPFSLGFGTAWHIGPALSRPADADPLVFALFFATALSISAMAVIAKTLMDMNLFRSDLGMTIMAAAIFEDFAGWTVFAVVLGMMGGHPHNMPIAQTIALTLAFAATMLTVGRKLIHRILPWVHAHTSWPGGVLGFTLSLAFMGAAFTEWVGVHAVFGAFIVGVAMGDSDHLRERTRSTIEQFVSFIFAPIFFASIGLKVNFLSHLNLAVVALVLVTACLGKVTGCSFGAWIAGMSKRESLAVGFGMNARGSMEIILGSLGLQYGLITQELFVALVVMTVFTAALSGPVMQRLLHRSKNRQFINFMSERNYVSQLSATDPAGIIHELAERVAPQTHLSHAYITAAVLSREMMMATGIGLGVAVPHARIKGLRGPAVAVGLVPQPVNFGAPDGRGAQLIFLLLTPQEDSAAQLELISDIAQTFTQPGLVQAALQTEGYTEFLALVRTREAKTQRNAVASKSLVA
jgi:Kef-type K+ transport system membrane component KefB/mannitol/fructose-specific phosphotransferase system IIA component (Ntr-type)